MIHEIWALEQGHFRTMQATEARSTPADLRAAALAVKPASSRGEAGGSIAVVPIYGPIEQRQSLYGAMFGGTSIARIKAMGRQAVNDPSVKAVVLDFSTPGGQVQGVADLHAEILSWRSAKPIVGQVNSVACSAGYWLLSACHEIVATQDAVVGALGIITTRVSTRKADQAAGIEEEILTAGEHKDQSSSDAPLTDVGRASLQQMLDYYYSLMVNCVAVGMSVTSAKVRSDFGKGLTLTVPAARAASMIHRVSTLDDTLSRLSSPQGRLSAMRGSTARPSLSASTVIQGALAGDGEAERRARSLVMGTDYRGKGDGDAERRRRLMAMLQ
ncbi:MAG: S49 family peptidase [Vicinamibacteria bacterium]